MLRLMDGRPRGPWTSADLAHLVVVQDAVLRHRLDHIDVAEDRTAAVQDLLDRIDAEDFAAVHTAPSTVHVSVVDTDGTACAVTASAGYGSGVMTPGTGLWLNNCLGEPELNRGGLHALPPGQRLPSNMAPTVGRRADGAVLAVGSPGADRITTALLQVLASLTTGGLSLQEAIDGARLHVRHVGDRAVVEYEEDLELPALDLPTQAHARHAMYFGGVGAALRETDGRLHAAADPRRAAVVAVGPPSAGVAGVGPR
jgi:gamma-glutamyltranspeptidase/glutathione hydrolase